MYQIQCLQPGGPIALLLSSPGRMEQHPSLNLPNIDWPCPDIGCPIASPLNDLAGLLVLNQQVNEPIHKLNILDLMFCPDELNNSVTTTDTYLSDHRIINVSTCIPKPKDIIQMKGLNPSSNSFERLDLNRCDWPQLAESLRPDTGLKNWCFW